VPFQFWPEMRRRRLQLHCLLGRIYAIAILFSGSGGFWLAITTQAGLAAALGFAALAIAWIGTTSVGVFLAMKGDMGGHRRWMLRSAGLTMAAVTLRLCLLLSMLGGLSYEDVSGLLAWACWVPNLIAAEFLAPRKILRKRTTALRAGMPA
jgi:uncharacterized membrane protein